MDGKIDWVAVIIAFAIVSTIFPSLIAGVKEVVAKWRASRHPEVG